MEMKSKRESFKALLMRTDSQRSSYEWYEIILFKTYLNVQFLFLKNWTSDEKAPNQKYVGNLSCVMK